MSAQREMSPDLMKMTLVADMALNHQSSSSSSSLATSNSHCSSKSSRQARIQDSEGGFVQEFRLENRSYPDVHDFSLRMQVIIAND